MLISNEEATALLGGPHREMPQSPKTPEEILEAMTIASSNFYRDAIRTNCHTFIEFTGLINKYVQLCEENLKIGIDFTQSGTHFSGPRLKMQPHDLAYLNEKIQCIFPNLKLVEVADQEEILE